MGPLSDEIVFCDHGHCLPSHLFSLALLPDNPLDLTLEGPSPQRLTWTRDRLLSMDDGFRLTSKTDGLELVTEWRIIGDRLVLRHDTLRAVGPLPLTLRRCQSLIHLPQATWEMACQVSAWCSENQGETHTLSDAAIKLQHRPGRTSEQSTPYAAFSNEMGERLSIHVLPVGNWTIRAEPVPARGGRASVRIAAGWEDDEMAWVLKPGESLNLPQILYGVDDPAALHRAWADANPTEGVPVVYNTWFRSFDTINAADLRKQLQTAAEVGCEVFVVDAGWFGKGEGWWNQAGDWQEQTERAFFGAMAAFATEVRDAGLGFGLWMEPERYCGQAPVRKEHPDWFAHPQAPFSRIHLEQPAPRAWLRGEIARLITTYDLAWMKVDFNFELGSDESGHALADYFRAWYGLIDELRRSFPAVHFEACSSGGLRLDLEVLRHFRLAFLSDTVNPWECFGIAQGAWRRLPPGRLGRWAVLRNREGVLESCGGASWDIFRPCSIDFALASTFLGALGLSGDLSSLSTEERERMREILALYKNRRAKIAMAEGYLLTGERHPQDHRGYEVVQLTLGEWNLVAAFRLDGAEDSITVTPHGVDSAKTYLVKNLLGGPRRRCPGREIQAGMKISLERANSAALLELIVEP